MTEDTTNLPPLDNAFIEPIGPFSDRYYVFSYRGCRIPFVQGHPMEGSDGMWTIFVDKRWGYDMPYDQVVRWLPLLADAMAVAAGYVCHGSDKRLNPHAVQMMCITAIRMEAGTEEDHD